MAFLIGLCGLSSVATAQQPSAAPRQRAGLQLIAPGEYQCFFLVDGKIFGIGSNRAGQLGIGHTRAAGHAVPVGIKVPEQVRFVDVAAGGYHSLAVDSTGRVWTWGSNFYGQKGDGSPIGKSESGASTDDGTPSMIVTDNTGKPFDQVVSVVSTLWFNVAVKRNGTVWVWGQNGDIGILGNGDAATVAVDRPTQVPFEPGVSIVQVSLARSMIAALDSAGDVWTWAGGAAPVENRGNGDPDFTRPRKLPNLPPIKQISVSSGFSFALDRNGELWGWGRSGTLFGLGKPEGSKQFVPVPRKFSFPEFQHRKVKTVVANWLSVHVILDDGTLWGWGDSAMGGVGNGAILDFSQHNYAWPYKPYMVLVDRPVQIAPKVRNFNAIYSNSLCFYTYATTSDGKVFSWGRNKTGILGNGIRPIGNVAGNPDSWNVATATQVSPLTVKKAIEVQSKP